MHPWEDIDRFEIEIEKVSESSSDYLQKYAFVSERKNCSD